MRKRAIFAVIELDEDVAEETSEEGGYGDEPPGEYLEREFGRLEQSGLRLDNWMITDEDDESRRARYVNYLIDWAMSHSSDEFEGMTPACYDEWCDNEDEGDGA